MSTCNIRIKLGKNDYTFTSDAELDSFLRSHSAELDKIASLTLECEKNEEFDNQVEE